MNSKDPGIHPEKDRSLKHFRLVNRQKPKAARRTRFFFDPRVEKIASKIMYLLVSEHNYGKSQCFMGQFTINAVIFHSHVKLPEGKSVS